MKKILILGCIVSFIFASCFKDTGNYEYKEQNTPIWLYNYTSTPIYVTTYAGDTAKGVVPFKFDSPDSMAIYNNLRYEWRVKGVLISEQKDLFVKTDSIIQLLNLPYSEISSNEGTFSVIDKTTGVKHMIRTFVSIRPRFFQGDWIILSENGGNSKLSFYKKKVRTGVDGKQFTTYTLMDNLYETVNGTVLPGSPLKLRYSQAMDVSVPVGATSVITDQGAYLINNENFELVSEYKNEFFEGTPPNFNVSNIFHSRLLAYIATTDGRLFRRVLTSNWLGGKFLTDPYVIDDLGYKVTDFGFGKTAQTSQISPVYDELNRRVMLIKMTSPYRIIPVTPQAAVEHPTPAGGMPEGTKLLYLGATSHKDAPYGIDIMFMVYNDAAGKTFMSTIQVNPSDGRMVESQYAEKLAFPGGNLPVGTKFLGTADSYKKNFFFYTKGKELRYINMINNEDRIYFTFDHNITDIKYAAYNVNYRQLSVAFDNGDFLMLDISVETDPKIIPATKVNVGGKIKDIMELRIDNFTDAY